MPRVTLKKYKAKRNLKHSPEPSAIIKKRKKGSPLFVVQKHAARSLHYDFRLEVDGVLKSWAVPKGPSMNPKDKRLAIMVEDHPIDYKDFEGVIPKGYGAGKVLVWDRGVYAIDEGDEPEKKAKQGLKKGYLHLTLLGKKLKGMFSLIKLKNTDKNWLLIKKQDGYASSQDVTKKKRSVISDLTLEQIGETKKKGSNNA